VQVAHLHNAVHASLIVYILIDDKNEPMNLRKIVVIVKKVLLTISSKMSYLEFKKNVPNLIRSITQ